MTRKMSLSSVDCDLEKMMETALYDIITHKNVDEEFIIGAHVVIILSCGITVVIVLSNYKTLSARACRFLNMGHHRHTSTHISEMTETEVQNNEVSNPRRQPKDIDWSNSTLKL